VSSSGKSLSPHVKTSEPSCLTLVLGDWKRQRSPQLVLAGCVIWSGLAHCSPSHWANLCVYPRSHERVRRPRHRITWCCRPPRPRSPPAGLLRPTRCKASTTYTASIGRSCRVAALGLYELASHVLDDRQARPTWRELRQAPLVTRHEERLRPSPQTGAALTGAGRQGRPTLEKDQVMRRPLKPEELVVGDGYILKLPQSLLYGPDDPIRKVLAWTGHGDDSELICVAVIPASAVSAPPATNSNRSNNLHPPRRHNQSVRRIGAIPLSTERTSGGPRQGARAQASTAKRARPGGDRPGRST
jgi:hypothetical protein